MICIQASRPAGYSRAHASNEIAPLGIKVFSVSVHRSSGVPLVRHDTRRQAVKARIDGLPFGQLPPHTIAKGVEVHFEGGPSIGVMCGLSALVI